MATWNVNSLRAHAGHVLSWVEREQPDVLALQETMCSEREARHVGFAGLGYEVVAHGEGGRGGVALVSRYELEDVQRGVAGAAGPFAEPRLISATIDNLRFHGVYAPNGRKVGTPEHAYKLAWFRFLGAVVNAEEATDVVILGDLNIAPSDRDVWDASRYRQRNLTSPAEREAFGALIETGLVDVVRAAHPTDRLFTWWNRRGDFYASDRGWRLDHVLASPTVAAQVSQVRVDRDVRGEPGAPDHAPLVVNLSR